MIKRSFKALLVGSTFLLAASWLSANALADTHGHDDALDYQTTALTKNLTLLQGKGGNIIAQTGPDGLLLVDNDYADMSPKLLAALDQLNPNKDQGIRYIVNTHWHGDHSGGNLALGKQAPIIAHRMVRERLSQPQELKAFNMKSDAYPVMALPSLVYDKQMTLHVNNETVHLIHLANGHTDGDSVVFFADSQVVHLGDHMFAGMFPFVDLDHGGNAKQLVKNLESLLPLLSADSKIVPGHGPLSTLDDLNTYIEMLKGCINHVETALAKGDSVETIQANGLPETWSDYANGFIKTQQWIGFIIQSLENS